jgi:hypothetical protein
MAPAIILPIPLRNDVRKFRCLIFEKLYGIACTAGNYGPQFVDQYGDDLNSTCEREIKLKAHQQQQFFGRIPLSFNYYNLIHLRRYLVPFF